ncbi:MAG: polyribonucleotide nucleotidyltransferase [Candidatus Schekmanbacteria bacterium]|nr:polyribonucleotide nucleotidyltransferase [Candidatus Schekmanbacteria bacterium]
MKYSVSKEIGGRMFTIETGQMARQADGAALIRFGDTVVLTTAVANKEPMKGADFLPLTVNYIEKSYAAGKIPGGFFKREGRPRDKETLTSRLGDRPIRPLFPKNYHYETQVISMVLSADQENDPDILAITGSSAALCLAANIPFMGPIAGVRVGETDGQLVINPTYDQLENSPLNIVIAGTADAIVMVEGFGDEISEEKFLEAILFAHQAIKEIVQLQNELMGQMGINKVFPEIVDEKAVKTEALKQKVAEAAIADIQSTLVIPAKLERETRAKEVFQQTYAKLELDDEEKELFDHAYHAVEKEELRKQIIYKGIRADGRGMKDIRKIKCDIGLLPRTHGSALFTRGETQALAITTLGTSSDEQRMDDLEGESTKRFMLHYNFPPFSVGEVSPLRSPGRREIGHGMLAERALKAVIPDNEEFPYTIRIVSDILESNGSSSMATVCGGSLSLMDAGVPIKSAVAGIAMGLIMENDKPYIITDILGLEDHLGDMDFKVAGTTKGITAIQLDVKIKGINEDAIRQILAQAREGRMTILEIMADTINDARKDLAPYAPKITVIQIRVEKIRDIIGPGGKNIKYIIEQTKAKIDVEDDGRVLIAAIDAAAAQKALELIKYFTGDVEIGGIYTGKVKKVLDFGAFVEVLPGTDGLLHISEIANYRVKNIYDVIREGDEVTVKVLDVDSQGKIRLSKKVLEQPQNPETAA